jgi:hypothetical protein
VRPAIYGLMAEFDSPEQLLAAAQRTYAEGYREMDAYSPFPVEGLSEAIGLHHNTVALVVLIGGVIGCIGGFFLQYYVAVMDFPINVGGRPLNSWPAFIPITFELTVLVASLAAFVGMLALNGLPMPYHPVFNVPRFALASRSRFFLAIESADPKFDREATARFLESLSSHRIEEIEW